MIWATLMVLIITTNADIPPSDHDDCRVELWGGPLDQKNYEVSLNVGARQGKIYQVADYWNGTGIQSGISSARVIGCSITMFDENGRRKCFLTPGEYQHVRFASLCQNNVVTQYQVGRDFRLVKQYAKCLSNDYNLGNGSCDPKECAKRCRGQPGCWFFAHGHNGVAKGQCLWEKTTRDWCPEGFQPDSKYNFYALLKPETPTREQCISRCPSNGCGNYYCNGVNCGCVLCNSGCFHNCEDGKCPA